MPNQEINWGYDLLVFICAQTVCKLSLIVQLCRFATPLVQCVLFNNLNNRVKASYKTWIYAQLITGYYYLNIENR